MLSHASKAVPKQTQDSTKTAEKELLKDKINYHSRDSIEVDLEHKIIHLYGKAEVSYEDIVLKAGYIRIDLGSNVMLASGVDSAGNLVDRPTLSEQDKETVADTIRYNVETKKGWMYRVRTSEGEGYMYAQAGKKDSNDVYYIKDGKYTTCDADQPHFHIHVTKGKVIPDNKIVTGPAYLVIAGIPTPLAIPFGFFPNQRGRKNGVLLPAYGESPALGFFLKDGGVYFGISDYIDLAVKGDIYSKGSFGLKTFTNYSKRYSFSGNIAAGYSNFRNSYPEFPDFSNQKDFFVRWTHTQDAKKNPGTGFSANVNILSSNYYKFNSNTSGDYLANTFSSNISYRRSWKEANLVSTLSHNQNTLSRKVDVGLPRTGFSLNRQYPAQWFNRGAHRNRAIDKIGFSLSSDFENRISVTDSNLFIPTIADSMKYAFKHTMPWSANFSFRKFPITLTPSASLSSIWYFETVEKSYDLPGDSIIILKKRGLSMANTFSASVAATTKLFMTYVFRRSAVKAIRHVVTPTIAYSVRPNYADPKYAYYGSYSTGLGVPVVYSIYENGIFGVPPSGESSLLSFAMNNNLEMKLRASASDTTKKERKITMIESFGFSSAWNYAADSVQLSPVNLYLRTKLFKKLDVNLLGLVDPYALGSNGTKVNRFLWNEGKLGRLTSGSVSVGTGLSGGKNKPKAGEKIKTKEAEQLKYVEEHPDYYVDFNIPWTLRVYYNLVYSRPALSETITQSVTFSGDFNLTRKWKIGFNSGYDFIMEDFTYTNVSIYRDLHCWEMQFNWIPFGFRKSYTIDIRVKASVLQDLKLSRKREWYDYN
ncbi:MAG: LPS-assembly protein LptD [Bacteroidia bacterium]|nr:LPS-assembly protein LptD [Bacteroidia bacterium]